MEMPGAKEDAMPEAGKGGWEDQPWRGGGDLGYRDAARAPFASTVPEGTGKLPCFHPRSAPLCGAGRGEASANPEVPDLGCRRPGVVGRRDTQSGGGKFVLGKKIKWRKLESVRFEGGRVFAVPLRSVLR